MFRPLTPRQLSTDVVIALLCLLLRALLQFEGIATAGTVLLMAAALAIRRLSPGLALAVAWLGAIVQMLGGLPPDLSNLAILAVLYSTARYGRPRAKWSGLASAGVGAVIATIYLSGRGLWPAVSATELAGSLFVLSATFLGIVATLGLSWTLGLLVLTWRTAARSRRDQLAAEQAAIVEQERNRIARDMHDVVAHSLAVVIAQADGARYAAAQDPVAVQQALGTISSTAREALGDVRLLLGQLRHSQDAGPQPALGDLDRLFEQLTASGLELRVETTGQRHEIPTAQQLAIYRIVQEALTNALRHGRVGSPATVTLGWAPQEVTVRVVNALRMAEPSADQPGHGLAGMRERALLVGGTLSAAAEDASFVVHAVIPVPVGRAA